MKLVLGLAILAVLLVIIIPIAVTAKRFVDANRKVRGPLRGMLLVVWSHDWFLADRPRTLHRHNHAEEVRAWSRDPKST